MLLWSAPALALGQRGHVLCEKCSFGAPGTGEGQLSKPAGVAVAESSGDVYVVDRANNRIERFNAKGEFLAAWGWGVSDGEKEYEVCTSGCRAGIKGVGKGQFDVPEAIAIDNSTSGSDPSRGDVYVGADAAAKHPDVQKFSAAGEALGRLPAKEEGTLDGVAVDSQGTVWLYRGEEETQGVSEAFSHAVHPLQQEPTLISPVAAECPKPGFAVDAGGENLYVDHELKSNEGSCPAAVEGETARSVLTAKLNAAEVLTKEEAAISELSRENTTAVAVDEASGAGTPLGEPARGDVYIDNGTSLAAFTSGGELIQRFGSGDLTDGAGIAVDSETGDLYVVDAAADRVQVFEPEPPGRPTVHSLSAENLTTSTRLDAEVSPEGADTHYYFQYGTVNCMTSPSSCTDEPAPPGTDIGEGFADRIAEVALQGLQPSTTYYYRVIATNARGEAEGSETFGSITTLPTSVGVLGDNRAWEMVSPPEKDGSAIEPLRLEGGVIQASEDGGAITYLANGPVVAKPEGNRSVEPTQVISTRSSEEWESQDLVTPQNQGEGLELQGGGEYHFFSADLSLGLVQTLPIEGGRLQQPPLAPPVLEGETQEKTIYLRDDQPLEPGASEQAIYDEAKKNGEVEHPPGYLPLVTAASDTAKSEFGERLLFVDATPDLSHVVFSSEVALTSAPGLYEWQSGRPESERLQPVGVLPDGVPASEPTLGQENANIRNAVSKDGSRVFWTEGAEPHRLYMRDMTKGKTIQVNAAHGVIEPAEDESEVGFQAASSDGSKVFFTDTAPLTAGSRQRPVPEAAGNPADLYECEVVEEGGALTCELKDLTALAAGGSADVLNVIPGTSEDGAYVYFVANGVLAPEAKPGDCVHQRETAPPGATCNLYLSHNGTITFIAALSNEDSGDWGSLGGASEEVGGGEPRPDLADVTARVSPNGEYLAFMSNMSLTHYDNTDVNEAGGKHADEEVFLYDAHTKLLRCASCNPSGARPTGVLDTENAGEGEGLLVDRRHDWNGSWLAGSVPGWTPVEQNHRADYQSRYLSDTGRLFFNSADALSPQAAGHTRTEEVGGEKVPVGVENVYEYEPDGEGSCTSAKGCVSLISSGTSEHESAFLDASVSGNDAFFLTAQPLLPQDRDSSLDLYDARVCSEASPCLKPPSPPPLSCSSAKSCNATSSSPPAVPAPATPALAGPGNLAKQGVLPSSTTNPKPLTRAQKLARALKSCRTKWKKAKKKRSACERQARRSYGAKKASAKKSSKRPQRGRR